MSESKYGKYLMKDCIIPSKLTGKPMMSTRQISNFGDGNFSIDCIYVNSTRVINDKCHNHTFAQYFGFFSANPNDATDFDAEIEMMMGQEQEKQLITVPTMVYIPIGLYHCPLTVLKINKPFLFLDIALTSRYAKTEVKS